MFASQSTGQDHQHIKGPQPAELGYHKNAEFFWCSMVSTLCFLPPGPCFEPPGAHFGPPAARFGPPRALFQPPGAHFKPPGARLGLPGLILALPGGLLGLSWGPPGASLGGLGAPSGLKLDFGPILGAILDRFGSPKGFKKHQKVPYCRQKTWFL